VLAAVGRDGAYANLAMAAVLGERGLTGRDAAFATELAFGSLRMRGLLDAVIAVAARREVERIDPPTRDVLRLGAHQVLHLRVPPHAAVATSVDLARDVAPQAAGFVNAVLRRVVERDTGDWIELVAPADPIGRLSVVRSHPRWIVTALRDALRTAPGGPDRLEELLAVDNTPAPVTLAVRTGGRDAVLAASGGEPGRWSPHAVRLSGGDPGALAAVRSGAAGVQDEGSQLVALALAGADLVGRDERWLDLCAGPGGKAALLAALGTGRGAAVRALELHPHRAALVRHALRAVPGAHEVRVADATADGWQAGQWDRVLVDVPCTGLGVLRRRPEARWRREPGDIAALAPLQRSLLAAAIGAARPGGTILYATCSPHIAETDLVVRDTLRRHPEVVLEPAAALLPGVPDCADGSYARLWPHIHDTDGMFLALLRKR
jgi:16S rRNA (cytosine967-C5)-methyltransferase